MLVGHKLRCGGAVIFSALASEMAFASCSSGIPRPPQSGPPTFADYPSFTLNFQPLDQPSGSEGHIPACTMESAIHTWRGDIHPTHTTSKFLTQHAWWSSNEHWQGPQIVSDGTTDYYHVIVGDEADGFVQEYYIPFGYTMNFEETWRTPNPSTIGYLWAPNQAIGSSLTETWRSASGGSADVKGAGTTIMDRWIVLGSNMVPGNGVSPLKDINHSSYGPIESGNGTGNPNKVIMRQKLDDGEMTQEFIKSSFSKKPKIIQEVRTTEMTSLVEIDMQAHSYNEFDNSAMTVVNTLIFDRTGPGSAPVADWSIENPDGGRGSGKVDSHVDAGQYIYSGGDASIGNANGQYSYADGVGGFDYENANWEAYMDTCDVTNIWSYDENRPTSSCP